MKTLLLAVFIYSINVSTAFADHPSHSAQELSFWGFKKFTPPVRFSSSNLSRAPLQTDLPFPMDLKFSSEQFGSAIHQFQDWTSPPYFHGGIDIRGEKNQAVTTPISGKIEGGYYSYVDEMEGKSTKYFLSLRDVLEKKIKPVWGKSYFEIAVTDRNGYRFEFHHIDPDLLTASIIEKILNGGTVAAGDQLGQIIEWTRFLLGVPFHHLHYNVVSPEGVYINPFAVSVPLNDILPPTIVGVYAPLFPGKCGASYPRLDNTNNLFAMPNKGYLIVEAFDQIFGGNERLAPPILIADFVGHESFKWDFTKSLELPDGLLPNITKMYLYYLCDEKGFLQPATRSNHFYFRIPLPSDYSGPVLITVIDQTGNSAKKSALISITH